MKEWNDGATLRAFITDLPVKPNVQSVEHCGIWHQVKWGPATEKILLEDHELNVETPESLPDYRAEANQIVWRSCVIKEQNPRNSQQNKGEDYKGRQHRRQQKVWKKTHTKRCPDLEQNWRNKQTNRQTNKFAKEEKLCVRVPDGYIISWEANWNTTEILITCEMSIGTAVITIAELILKDTPVSLH